MSRAFVKESDREVEAVPLRHERRSPYYMTPSGFARLQDDLACAKGREADELRERISAAVVVDPAQQTGTKVAFGARVTVEMPDKSRQTYRIVGEDEAEPPGGSISWTSPLAQAMWDKRAGSRAIWERPAGTVKIRIASVEYG